MQSKYAKQAIVLMGDNIVKFVISFIMSIFVARIFGPVKFGKINYVLAVITFLQVLVLFGFDSIAKKDLGLKSCPENSIIKTVITLRFGLAVIAYTVGFCLFWCCLGREYVFIYLIIGLELFCYIYDIYKQFFQIHSLNKYPVLASQIAFFSLIALKIFYLCFFDNLCVYAAFLLFSCFLETLILSSCFFRFKGDSTLKFDAGYAKKLIKESFPVLLNSFAIILYMKVDQVMIGKMLSEKEVGLYSVAVTISEIISFVPVSVMNAFYPKVAEAKKDGRNYRLILEKVGQLNVSISLLWGLFCTFFMPLLIALFYGENYSDSARVIQIHGWGGIFVSIGVSSTCELVFENKQKLYLYSTASAAVLNVMLNSVLIRIVGINGAAIATVISYSFAAYFFYVFVCDKNYFLLRSKFFLIYRLLRTIRHGMEM